MRERRLLLPIFGMLLLLPVLQLAAAEPAIEQGFLSPPETARPWVYWFWLNGNITREGITADLEAMRRVGIGGVVIMEVHQGSPPGPVGFMSDRWRALFKFMISEAQRLGIEVNMNNDAGWNGSGGPWVPLDKAMQVVTTSETRVAGGRRFEGVLSQPRANGGHYRDIAVLAFPTPPLESQPNAAQYRIAGAPAKTLAWGRLFPGVSGSAERGGKIPADATVARSRIVDLTAQMDKDGRLTWDAPAGPWTVIRFGHTFTGAASHPAPPSGAGPECDKLSKEGIETHFNGMMRKLIDDVGPAAGKTLAATHVDSWEVGSQNWTPRMREEFQKRRGYDMLPLMPTLTGRVVDSIDVSERFLWDLRQTASELLAENYIGHLRTLAHTHGMRLSMESYTTPANDLEVINHVDEPICEFWWPDGGWVYWSLKAMTSAAHLNNCPIVSAEAFTAGKKERWLAHPANIKALGDRAFCEGVNRFIIHRYAMQPWLDRRPGMTMGPWGLHYERTQTWWEQSTAWHTYLARCQYMLRQGHFVADVLALQPEEPMARFRPIGLSGYDYDACSPQLFLDKVSVQDGRWTLPHAVQYRLLLLPETKLMTLPMLRKIKVLVEAGAVVLGNPPQAVPGLADYPQADAQLKQLADALWGTDANVKERSVGRGRVFRGMRPEEVLAKIGVAPDFTADRGLRSIHRTVDGMEIYFVASDAAQAQEAVCTFRTSGKHPELWDPETGRIAAVRQYEEKDGKIRMPLRLASSGSVFVVFRPGTLVSSQRVTSVVSAAGQGAIDLVLNEAWQSGSYAIQTADGKTRRIEIGPLPGPLTIAGPWEVQFPAKGGAPERVTFDKLVSWSQHAEAGIKYFSGTAFYHKKLDVPRDMLGPRRRLYLDLGRVEVMAQVKLNGTDLGILWKSPYRVEITEAVHPGENSLEISVVNLWPNRMIGDEQLPEDSVRTPKGTLQDWPRWLSEGKPSPTGRHAFSTWRLWNKGDGLLESGLLGPVRVLAAETLPDGGSLSSLPLSRSPRAASAE